LSHQDIGDWPFCHHPWPFALPYRPGRHHFSKPFLGAEALAPCRAPFTYPFVGDDLRKVSPPAEVCDQEGQVIGQVLTCVTDMAIGWCDNRVVSIASPDRPQDFKAGGLSCGFVKVTEPLPWNKRLTLKDKHRQIAVRVVKDIRPDRTARQPIHTMLQPKEE
jgi:aminomethyltransferase